MVAWPAVIKFSGDDELSFVASQDDWQSDAHLNAFCYGDDDVLIDSDGVIHSLQSRLDHRIQPMPRGESLDQNAVLELLKAHFSVIGQCCVSKMGIGSIAQGILMVASEG